MALLLAAVVLTVTTSSTGLSNSATTTTFCNPPPCVNPCGDFNSGFTFCKKYPNAICISKSDCSDCWAEYRNGGFDGEIIDCQVTYIQPTTTTTTTTTTTSTTTTTNALDKTTPCQLPPCVNPCSPFENLDLSGGGAYCKGYPNTRCQGYADCTGCYAKYFDDDTDQEIINCELKYGLMTTSTPTTTTEAEATMDMTEMDMTEMDMTEMDMTEMDMTMRSTESKNDGADCSLDCADPCPMSECPAYPDATCDFTVDCDKGGCYAFYTDDKGNELDCDEDPYQSSSNQYGILVAIGSVFMVYSLL